MSLRKFMIASIALFSLTTACGKKTSHKENAPIQGKTDDSVNKSLFATWGTITVPMTEDASGIELGKLELAFRIADGVVTAISTCSYELGFKIGPVENTSAANISQDTIEILEAKEATKHLENSAGKFNCTASTKKGKMTYELKGDTLELKSDNDTGVVLDLKRI